MTALQFRIHTERANRSVFILPAKVMAFALRWINRIAVSCLPKAYRTYAISRMIEESIPVYQAKTPYGTIKLLCPGSNPFDRAHRFMTKERDTVAWIDQMEKGSILWDIGANVGTFSLYAAKHGVHCIAFEPEASNFWLLNRNIDLNGLFPMVTPLNFAVTDNLSHTHFRQFGINKIKIGGAGHPGLDAIGNTGRTVFTVSGRQLVNSFHLPSPNYIKIDVDGHEVSVLRGLDLEHPKLKSIQVELRQHKDSAQKAWAILERYGFYPDRPIIESLKARQGKATNFRFERRNGEIE